MNRMLLYATLALPLAACDLLPVEVDRVGTCSEVCTRIDECAATPPSPQFGNFKGSSGEVALDCAANCTQTDAELYGYSDCQLDCLQNADCDKLDDCWKPKSETFATYCLADRDVPAISPDPSDPIPDNGSESGSDLADELLRDPSSGIAIDESDFDVNYGDEPPMIVGRYAVVGTIDESANARPSGSPIDTSLCFWGQESLAGGPMVTYCEDYVPGQPSAPVTGSGDDFTVYLEYPGQATLLFSGKVDGEGRITNAETLVVYTYGVDMWEHSVTDWGYDGQCNSCL